MATGEAVVAAAATVALPVGAETVDVRVVADSLDPLDDESELDSELEDDPVVEDPDALVVAVELPLTAADEDEATLTAAEELAAAVVEDSLDDEPEDPLEVMLP